MFDLFHEELPEDYIREIFAVMERAPRHVFHALTKREARLLELAPSLPWPANVWMGVTVESMDYARRVAALRAVPAAVRHISAEPLLGPLDELDLSGIDWVIAGGESGPTRRPPRPEWLRGLRDRCHAQGVAFTFKGWGGRVQGQLGRELDGREWDEQPPVRCARRRPPSVPANGPRRPRPRPNARLLPKRPGSRRAFGPDERPVPRAYTEPVSRGEVGASPHAWSGPDFRRQGWAPASLPEARGRLCRPHDFKPR